MEVFPNIKEYKNTQEWWKKSKKALRKNISEAMKTCSEDEVLKDMVELLDRIKVQIKKSSTYRKEKGSVRNEKKKLII